MTRCDVTATAQLTKIKAAGPQALIIWAPGTPFATALRAVSRRRPRRSDRDDQRQQSRQAADADTRAFMPKELYFPGVTYAAGIAQNPRVKHQQDAYFAAMKAAGVTTDLQTGMPWDAGLITRRSAAQTRRDRDRRANPRLHRRAQRLARILGMYDFTKMPQRGVERDDVVMMRWTGTGWLNSSSFGGALK